MMEDNNMNYNYDEEDLSPLSNEEQLNDISGGKIAYVCLTLCPDIENIIGLIFEDRVEIIEKKTNMGIETLCLNDVDLDSTPDTSLVFEFRKDFVFYTKSVERFKYYAGTEYIKKGFHFFRKICYDSICKLTLREWLYNMFEPRGNIHVGITDSPVVILKDAITITFNFITNITYVDDFETYVSQLLPLDGVFYMFYSENVIPDIYD